jgi:dihydroneopterin aldolase
MYRLCIGRRVFSQARPSRDCLFLKEAVFHGYHGVFDEEHELGQKFIVDLEIYTDFAQCKDRLSHSIDMTRVYRDVEEIVGASKSKYFLHKFPFKNI